MARPAGERPKSAARLRGALPAGPLTLLFCVLALGLALDATTAGFSWIELLANASLWALLGLAAATVILGGGIDISIGSLVALSAACAALVLRLPLPAAVTLPAAIVAGTLVGAAGGLANGALSLLGRIHPIVVTLGTMTVYRGLVILLLGGRAVTGLPPEFGRLAFDPASGVRGSLLLAAIVAAIAGVGLNYTRAGRALVAVGGNPAAARLAGISRSRSWLLAFGLGGALAGLAGVLELAQSEQMQSRLGLGWELNAIAVAVIGGVAITGGRGGVAGVLLGAVLLRLINSALVRWSVSDDQFEMFVGAMILGAVLFDLAWRRVSGLAARE